MTTKEHVLLCLIENWPQVPNHIVLAADPAHPLSGGQRLRELRKDYMLAYTFDKKTNVYTIGTSKAALRDILAAYRVRMPLPKRAKEESQAAFGWR